MSQHLSPENQAYIDDQVAGGVYTSREEAIDAGIALLRKRNELVVQLKESRRQLDKASWLNTTTKRWPHDLMS